MQFKHNIVNDSKFKRLTIKSLCDVRMFLIIHSRRLYYINNFNSAVIVLFFLQSLPLAVDCNNSLFHRGASVVLVPFYLCTSYQLLLYLSLHSIDYQCSYWRQQQYCSLLVILTLVLGYYHSCFHIFLSLYLILQNYGLFFVFNMLTQNIFSMFSKCFEYYFMISFFH